MPTIYIPNPQKVRLLSVCSCDDKLTDFFEWDSKMNMLLVLTTTKWTQPLIPALNHAISLKSLPLSDPGLMFTLVLKLSAIREVEQPLIILECKFCTPAFLVALEGWSRMIHFAIWWLRELSTLRRGGRGCKPWPLISHLWQWQPQSRVIAAPSCDLQPQSCTPHGRFVHPSRPLVYFRWASAASLPAKCTRLSVRTPWGFVVEVSRASLFKMHSCACLHSCSTTDALTSLLTLSRIAEPVREPDRRGVSDHREDHQPGRSEDSGSAGERLWPYLFHHQHQTTQGQVSMCYREANLAWCKMTAASVDR